MNVWTISMVGLAAVTGAACSGYSGDGQASAAPTAPAPTPPSSAPAPSAAPSSSQVPTLPPGVVQVEGGLVRGVQGEGSWSWKGIPFAAPPTGALRWRPPAPVIPWEGTREADSFGARCPQLDGEGAVVGDEDCLTLNVWAPAGAQHAPVMVWIHGGR